MRKRLPNRIIITITIGFVVVILGWLGTLRPVTGVLSAVSSPVMRMMRISGGGTGGFFGFMGQIKDLNQQNTQLQHEINDLRQQLAQDAQLRVQDAELKQQLNFSQTSSRQLVTAEVIAYQPDNFRAFVTINRGMRDGLANGMAVISQGFLVGKLTDVQDATAKVFLSIDPDFRVAVADQNGTATGIVQGQIGSGLVLHDVPQDQQIKPGDTLVTSGLGGDFPRGLIVGQIEAIDHQDNAIFQSAQVISSIKINQLDLVFVVKQP